MSAGPGEQQDWDAVVPYTGPPRYGPANPPPAPFGYPPPAWGPAPRSPSGPSRPWTTVAAAVLAFVLALLTLFGTVYAMVFSALLAVTRRSAGGLGPWISLVHLGLVAALVTGGVLVLGGRRTWLLAAAAAEVALSVYWAVVLDAAALPGLGGGVFGVPVFFAVLAAVTAGLATTPSARAWRPGRATVPGS